MRWFEFGEFIQAKNKTLDQVKELGFIFLKEKITENYEEKEILRNMYKKIQQYPIAFYISGYHTCAYFSIFFPQIYLYYEFINSITLKN